MPLLFRPKAELLTFQENLQRKNETRIRAHQRRFLFISLDLNKRSNNREIQSNRKKVVQERRGSVKNEIHLSQRSTLFQTSKTAFYYGKVTKLPRSKPPEVSKQIPTLTCMLGVTLQVLRVLEMMVHGCRGPSLVMRFRCLLLRAVRPEVERFLPQGLRQPTHDSGLSAKALTTLHIVLYDGAWLL